MKKDKCFTGGEPIWAPSTYLIVDGLEGSCAPGYTWTASVWMCLLQEYCV